MQEKIKQKIHFYLPILISLSMVIGIYIGYRIHRQLPYERDFFDMKPMNKWMEIQNIIQNRYVENIKIDSLVEKNINVLFSSLDPYSKYISAKRLSYYEEEIEGNFYGIGVQFRMIDDTMNVIAVIDGGPSSVAGLESGDKIVSVNNEIIANKKYSNTTIQKYFKGEKGKKLNLVIYRNNKKKNITIITGSVPIHSVTSAYMVNKEVGYIKLENFSKNSHEEISYNLEKLTKQGMKKLILDLRYNPGGILSEAVDIADEFLDGDKLVTYTNGEHQERKEYRCRRKGLFEQGEIVVLLNNHSASASEVVSGALQDWERAIIVGDTSYGKGLVQEQFLLQDGSAMRLTVAKYYTPLGRNIQKSFTSQQKKIDTFYTTKGTQLYSLAGIIPNIICKEEESIGLDSAILMKLFKSSNNDIFSFVFRYYSKHKKVLEASNFATYLQFTEHISKNIYKEAIRYFDIPYSSLKYQKQQDKLKYELLRILCSYMNNGKHYQKYLNKLDKLMPIALQQLN